MATLERRLPTNQAGDFFVDSSCIDCDTCRWMAPETFNRAEDQSRVFHQPKTSEEKQRAFQALISCPTASIGTVEKHSLKPIQETIPILLDGEIYHCGYHSEASFGAASYLIRRPEERGGNVLIDSPRFNMPLVKRLEAMGGVKTLFLTHSDDLADQDKFAKHFGCTRVMHAAEAPADIEVKIDGLEAKVLDADLTVIPVPGHTRGSSCLLYKNKYLFTGDHLAWSETREHVYAFRSACWYDWNEQIRSMEHLAKYRFEWILPGHGWRCHFSAEEMAEQMKLCLNWMKRV